MTRPFDAALCEAEAFLERAVRLDALYRAGEIHARTPGRLMELDCSIEDAIAASLPQSHAALEAARHSLFYSLPVAFDPAESVGCFLATADRDERGEPFRFIDMGAQIATRAFGENDPSAIEAVLRELPCAVNRFAHSEYQTVLSLRMKAALDRIAPPGAPRHFVVNTGAEAVENAIKAVLLNRVVGAGEKDGGFIISFEGAFHGRTLGALAVTHRKKARIGFPTFDWPQAPFPTDDPREPAATQRREEKSLRQVWDLLVSGRLPGVAKGKEAFRKELDRIDRFLAASGGDVAAFVAAERAALAPEAVARARRVAAVLIEPIQGEGGVRMASARFFKRLRLLTRIYDVPLVFDEVQTGFGATGRLWGHELFELPAPPDVITWAKKAQNGVLFVSQELATFFQEEKKFNTTWEGDSAGMVRFIANLDRLDLGEVRRTGELARAALDGIAREVPELIMNVRGAGVLLGFDVARADWRDVLRDRAFRRGLILLPAGERALRFYPRYDTTPAAIEEAAAILRRAVEDVLVGSGEGGRGEVLLSSPAVGMVPLGPNIRVGALDVPIASVEATALDPKSFAELRSDVMAVEIERYGLLSQYPSDVMRAGRRPLLQYPVEALEASIANARSTGIALRDRVSGRVIAYAMGSPLENYDEEGVRDDPHYGENQTFYLHATATLPSVRNQDEVENHLLDLLRVRVSAMGFEHLSALIEDRLRETGPAWLHEAQVLRTIANYLRSGRRFVYVQAELGAATTRRDPL